MDISSLTAIREKAYRNESNIRDLLMLVPESLRRGVYELSTSAKLRYSGTVLSKTQLKEGGHPYFEWQASLDLRPDYWNFCNFDDTAQILFSISYFGGGIRYRPAQGSASYMNISRPCGWSIASQTFVVNKQDDLLKELPAAYLPEDAVPALLQAISDTIPIFAIVIRDFIFRQVALLGNDAWFLLRRAHDFQQNQKEFLKTEKVYQDFIQEARKELPEIIEGLRSSKSFAKSLILKGLRERMEKILERLSLITTPEFWKEMHKTE